MKKITLIAAVAALTASSAIAATPQTVAAAKATKAVAELTQVTGERLLNNDLRINNRIETTAEGDDQVTIDVEVSYVPSANAFYLGFSPETYAYKSTPQAFTGIRNQIGFRNMTQGADAFMWATGRVSGINAEGTDYTYEYTESTDTNFFMTLTPADQYTYPTLNATVGTDEFTYAPTQWTFYHCGQSPADWGWYVPETAEEVDEYVDLFGVSPCTAAPGATLFPEYMISRPEASNYDTESNDANGTPVNWYAYSSETEIVENIKIKAFGTYIPEMPSPYMLNAMWAWINTVETKGAVTLPVNVYALNEEGTVDYNSLLGCGELSYPEGATEMSVMPLVSLYAVDADGYAIDAPVCVPEGQGVMVCIEGLDNENLLRFDLVANSNCTYPLEKADYNRYLFPNHAYTFIDCTITEVVDGVAGTPEEISTMLSAPYRYYTDNTYSALIDCSDFAMYFDVYFPLVVNFDEASADYYTANFNAEIPVEGGEVVVPVYCDYVIDTLIEEQMVTATATADWITFSQAFDETQSITNVTISAAALPEGETGRTGYVVYEGYAIDFYIAVTQGEASGIDNIVVTPVAKGTKFYDLQGRQLQAAPAAGMYIESVDGKATKRLAR